MPIRVGDVVQLKSGGPKMTVTTLDQRGNRVVAICTWFEGAKHTHGTFALEALQAVESGPTVA
jgi:uncharacterized protein YodC (DUF2158 family)